MLEFFHKYILIFHIAAGSVSLVTFLIPIFLKKGGNLHRKIGWVYVYTMWAVIISAAVLSILNAFSGRIVSALFLGFLSVLTASPLWSGIAILKHKKSLPDSFIRTKKILAWATLLFGFVNVVIGLLIGFAQGSILIFFGLIGLTALNEVISSKEKLQSNANWFNEHVSGMVVGGIAAYTAFFAFGGRALFGSFLTDGLMFIPWVVPTFMGVWLMRKYRVKVKRVA